MAHDSAAALSSSQAISIAHSERIETRTNSLRSDSVRVWTIRSVRLASDRCCSCGISGGTVCAIIIKKALQTIYDSRIYIQRNYCCLSCSIDKQTLLINTLCRLLFISAVRYAGAASAGADQMHRRRERRNRSIVRRVSSDELAGEPRERRTHLPATRTELRHTSQHLLIKKAAAPT